MAMNFICCSSRRLVGGHVNDVHPFQTNCSNTHMHICFCRVVSTQDLELQNGYCPEFHLKSGVSLKREASHFRPVDPLLSGIADDTGGPGLRVGAAALERGTAGLLSTSDIRRHPVGMSNMWYPPTPLGAFLEMEAGKEARHLEWPPVLCF